MPKSTKKFEPITGGSKRKQTAMQGFFSAQFYTKVQF